jgi:hypothetical protein
MALIDLSAPISPDPPDVPELLRTEIDYEDHAAGAAAIEALFGVGSELLRDGEGWATDTFLRLGRSTNFLSTGSTRPGWSSTRPTARTATR